MGGWGHFVKRPHGIEDIRTIISGRSSPPQEESHGVCEVLASHPSGALGAAIPSQDPGCWLVPFSVLKKWFPQREMSSCFPEWKFLPGHWDLQQLWVAKCLSLTHWVAWSGECPQDVGSLQHHPRISLCFPGSFPSRWGRPGGDGCRFLGLPSSVRIRAQLYDPSKL